MKRSPQRSIPGTGFGHRTLRSKYRRWFCEGGPLHGQFIELSNDDDGKSAVIECSGQIGIYDRGQWVPSERPSLYLVR